MATMITIEMMVIIQLHFDTHRKKMTVILLTKIVLMDINRAEYSTSYSDKNHFVVCAKSS